MLKSGPASEVDNNNLQAIVTRNAFTQSATASVFALHEEHIRTKALVAIETPLLKLDLAKEFSYFLPRVDTNENMILLHDIGKQEVARLHKTATPIGKAGLPTMVHMWDYPEVFEHILKQEYKEAMLLFRDQYVKNVGLSDPLLNRLKYSGWALGITAAGISTYQIAKSEDKFEESIHQTALFTGSLTGAIEAGTLALAPCSVLAIWAPLCVAGASCAGSILGTELGEHLYQMAKEGKFSALLSSKAHAAEPTAPAIPSIKFNTNTATSNLYLKKSSPILNVDEFLDQYSLPLFRNNPTLQKKTGLQLLSQSTLNSLHNAWYSGPSNSPLKQLSKQLDNLNYLIRYQSPFLTQEGKNQLYEAQQQLHTKIDQHAPNANEVSLYLEIKNKLSALEQVSKPLLTSRDIKTEKLNLYVEKVFQAKTSHALKSAWEDLIASDATNNTPLSEEDQAVRTYLKDFFAYNYGTHNFKASNSAQANQESAFMIDNAGRAGIELGRIAYSFKNPELGDALTIMGAAAQGVSSAILFMQATGALAMGHFVGVVGALATVISVFMSSDANGMQEAFQEIFQQLILLRQELYELRKFMAQFKTDLFEYLNVYFGTVFSRFIYQEEIIRNGQSKSAYEFEQGREGIDAIHNHLDDEVIYQVNAYYKKIRNTNTLSRNETEQYLTALKLRLDKAASDYRSGITACQGQVKHGVVAAAADRKAMLYSPSRRGQIPGYLTCYYQTTDWLFQKNITLTLRRIINPALWSDVAQLYLFLRQLASASEYDPQFVELMEIRKQGDDYIEFVYQHQENFQTILNSLFHDTQFSINMTLKYFEYSENLKKLIKIYPVPQHLQAIMNRHPDKGGHAPRRELSNEFLALEAIGFGKFTSSSGELRNPGDGRWLFPHNWDRNVGLTPWPSNNNEQTFINKHFIQFQYTNAYHKHAVKLAFMAPDDLWDRGNDGLWTHGVRVTSGFSEYANQVRTEARNFVLQIRRNATKEIVTLLEKELPKFQKNFVNFLWHAYATLIIAGAPETTLNAFPMLELPEELSPWVNLYRADLQHEDVFRALPRLNNEIDALSNFAKQLGNYSIALFNFVQNYTAIFFRNRDVALVSTQLLALNEYYTQATLGSPRSLENALNQSRKAIIDQQKLLDDSFDILHRAIATLSDLPIPSHPPLTAWNQSLEAIIQERNENFSPTFIREAHRAHLDDSQAKKESMRNGTELENLCSDPFTSLSNVEKALEKLSTEGVEYRKKTLNTASNTLLRPLHLAIQARRNDIVELLLKYDAVIKQEDLTAINVDADDAVSQGIAALLDFYDYMQSYDLGDEIEPGRTLTLIKIGIEKLMRFISSQKEGILVLGKSRGGKSTFVNTILGIVYEAIDGELRAKEGYIEHTKTGHTIASETAFPEIFEFSDTLIGDMSGFGDTRGHSYETAAGVTIQMLKKILKSIRLLVLVCETPYPKKSGKDIIDIFNMYGGMIGQSTARMQNVLILINEDIHGNKRTVQEVIARFKSASSESSALTNDAQFFMSHLTEKNILIADFLNPSFRQEFSNIVNQTQSTPIAEFNFESFHRHVESFKKLMCRLEQYAKTSMNNQHQMIAHIALEQLQKMTDINADLTSKAFLPKVNYEQKMLPLQSEEYYELNRYLENQGHWQSQLLKTVVTPMITTLTSLYDNQTVRQIGSLQKIEQLALCYQVAQSFLKQIELTGLMRSNSCSATPASTRKKQAETVEIDVKGTLTKSTSSFGIPGVGAAEIDMTHYILDEDGFLFYQTPLEITPLPSTRFYDGKMQTCCAYQWRHIFSITLPKTTLYANNDLTTHALMPLCSASENRIEFKFWKESTLRLSQTNTETHIELIPSVSLTQFVHQGNTSFILGATGGFTYPSLKNIGATEIQAKFTTCLLELGLACYFYGASSLLITISALCLRHSPLNLSESQTKNLSFLLVIGMNIYQSQERAEQWLVLLATQILFSSFMHYAGQKTGIYAAKLTSNFFAVAKVEKSKQSTASPRPSYSLTA